MINIWGLFFTILLFLLIKKYNKIKYLKKLPAMFITSILLIIFLKTTNISYDSYNSSACYLTLLLGPATIALGYPLYVNRSVLLNNKRAIYFGFVVATIVAIFSTYIFAKLSHFDFQIINSLIPKSVTAPIALEISKMIGGIPEITACIVAITGLFGAVFGHKILSWFHVKSDVAKGLSIGAVSHVLGTASCIEKNKPKQVVMATISLIIIGILTTVFCLIFFK